jgi:hypothetical protein
MVDAARLQVEPGRPRVLHEVTHDAVEALDLALYRVGRSVDRLDVVVVAFEALAQQLHIHVNGVERIADLMRHALAEVGDRLGARLLQKARLGSDRLADVGERDHRRATVRAQINGAEATIDATVVANRQTRELHLATAFDRVGCGARPIDFRCKARKELRERAADDLAGRGEFGERAVGESDETLLVEQGEALIGGIEKSTKLRFARRHAAMLPGRGARFATRRTCFASPRLRGLGALLIRIGGAVAEELARDAPQRRDRCAPHLEFGVVEAERECGCQLVQASLPGHPGGGDPHDGIGRIEVNREAGSRQLGHDRVDDDAVRAVRIRNGIRGVDAASQIGDRRLPIGEQGARAARPVAEVFGDQILHRGDDVRLPRRGGALQAGGKANLLDPSGRRRYFPIGGIASFTPGTTLETG